MVDRFVSIALLVKPGSSFQVQRADLLNMIAPQERVQDFGEQVLVAKPLTLVIQWNQEQVLLADFGQRLPTGRIVNHCLAQRPTEALQDGSLQQEFTLVFGQGIQDFFGQVIQDELVSPGELLDKAVVGWLSF